VSRKKDTPKRRAPVLNVPSQRGLVWGGVTLLGIGIAAAAFWFERGARSADTPPQVPQTAQVRAAAAQYVGSRACVSCHGEQAEKWRTSQHQGAMAEATEERVLGNFNDVTFTYAGTTSTFFKRDGRFRVRTDGRDGTLADFDVKYTFGVYPLQQYLIEFPDGRLQALSIAWDARPKQDGGQRWFHLYPGERVTHNDELHWTRPAQNWNFMCADCHSTGLQKNYDPAADRFSTSWADINVSCEACHGPGSRHLEWAKGQHVVSGGSRTTAVPADDNKGLTVNLDERRGVAWSVNVLSGNADRSHPRTTEREIEVCAQCHSRRGQIAEGYEAGKPLLDHYRPALLDEPLYYADGQQRGEVYNWGSFLQSKMHAKGVTCSDCHEPHNGKLRAEGNALCSTCHLASKYDATRHTHHTAASAGALCVACHMSAATYMVVDPRHDHSLRVPRPALSVTLGTPNACNACHTNHDARWAAARVKAWYGHHPQGYQRFAAAFSAASAGTADGQSQLRAVAIDATEPPIVRATALARINSSADGAAIDTLAKGLRDPSGVVRLGALQSLANAPVSARVPLAALSLSDPLKAVRAAAVSLLEFVPAEQLSADARAGFERAIPEYFDTQRYNADRAEARVNVGTFQASRGDGEGGEKELKAAIRLDPFFIPAYVNLADLYRALGRDTEGERILRQGLDIAPASGVLHYALGLALVRLKKTDEALAELQRASALEPANTRFAYAYGIALHSTGHADLAKATLEKALAAHPDDENVRAALTSITKERQP
jgi:tetratricopeptide (TPR) repeat protein